MIAIISAPTNLGLRPPQPGAVPGTAKAPEAFREAGLHRALTTQGATDAGVVLPGRYLDDDANRPPGRLRNQEAIVNHARLLAARIRELIDTGDAPLVLGGDCSLVVAAGLALDGTRGLVHVDGHTDFRHPGNSTECASLAGEDLAAAIGLHWPAIADIDGRGPYFAATRTAHLGCRDNDDELDEARAAIAHVRTSPEIAAAPADAARAARDAVGPGFWLQLDVDVLDASVMPAVDSPDPGGLLPEQLRELLRELAPHAAGASVTVFDPDLDPTGDYARLLTDLLVDGLGGLGTRLTPARGAS